MIVIKVLGTSSNRSNMAGHKASATIQNRVSGTDGMSLCNWQLHDQLLIACARPLGNRPQASSRWLGYAALPLASVRVTLESKVEQVPASAAGGGSFKVIHPGTKTKFACKFYVDVINEQEI